MTNRFLIMGIVSSILGLFGCNNDYPNNSDVKMQIAKRIEISELEGQLELLVKGKLKFDFLGITSNGIDCLYFVQENNSFQLEYEAMISEQLPYIDSLKAFAEANNIKTINTTYGNQPNYVSNNPAPVIRLVVNANISEVSAIGKQIEFNIFKNSQSTQYDVVP